MRFKIRMGKALLLFLMVLNFMFFMTGLCHAQADKFTQPIQLFDLPAGARAPGMGGAFTALSDDASAPLWNPAGLTQLKTKSFTFMQSKQSISQTSDDIKYNFLSVAYPLSLKSAVAVTYLDNGIGNLENWQVTDYDPDEPAAADPCIAAGNCEDLNPGTEDTFNNNVDIFDDQVDLLGMFENKESAIVVSYSQELKDSFSVGANVKFYNHKIGSFQDPTCFDCRKPTFTNFTAKATAGFGIDLGILYKLAKPPKGIDALSLGLVVQDVSQTKVKWNTGSTESQATNVRAGIAAKLLQEKLTLALDYNKRTEKGFRAGAEYWINPMLGLRLGSDDGVFTAGVSFHLASESIKGFQIDYAYKKFNESDSVLSNSSLIAITVGF